MDQKTIRRLAALCTLLTVVAALVTAACVGLVLLADGGVLPLLVAVVVTALLAGATLRLFGRLED